MVTVKRDACGGCFNRIPPQRQVDIRQGKKIIICEYCGRILVADPDERRNRDDTNSEKASGKPGAFFVFKYFCKCGNVNLLTSKIFPTFANNP